MVTLHEAWGVAIAWVRKYIKDCEEHEQRPNYKFLKQYIPRMVRRIYQGQG